MSKVSIWNSSRPKNSTNLEWCKEVVSELLDGFIATEKAKLDAEASISNLHELEVMKLDPIEVDSLYHFPGGYENNGYWGYEKYQSESSINSICQKGIDHVDRILKSAEKQHFINLDRIANNKIIIGGITKMMDNFGVRGSWTTYEYPSSRSRTRKEVTHRCGWPAEVSRFIPTDDGFSSIERSCKSRLDEIEKWKQKKLLELSEIQKKKDLEEKDEKNRRALAQYQVKYGLEPESDWSEVMDEILSKDKYLKLAWHLEENRNDWNDGYWLAECGLYDFNIEDETDQLIHDEINLLIDNWDNDGRVFRDCKWNYAAIYSLADSSLYDDLVRIKPYL